MIIRGRQQAHPGKPFALFLIGKFSAGIARMEERRLLRPGAGWLLLGAYLCFLVTAGLAGMELASEVELVIFDQ